MKKLLLITLFIVLVCLIGCGEKEEKPVDNDNEEETKLLVSYYHGNDLIFSKEYTDNSILIIDYSITDYEFMGWFLDKEFTIPYDETKVKEYFKLDSLNLYAKMERNMEEFKVNITGKLNNEYVLNPLFTWDDSNNDSSFTYELSKNGEVVFSKTTTSTSFQPGDLLNANSNYQFKVTGNSSGCSDTINFMTLKDYKNTVNQMSLDNPFSNGMVIQRNMDTVISGKAPVKQLITLTIGSEVFHTISSEDGQFEVVLPGRNSSFFPVDITISNGCGVSKAVSDVLFGDVYLFAGQSNMQWPTQSSDYFDTDIQYLANSRVRFFCQDVVTSTEPKEATQNGRWFKPDTNNVKNFSAIATMTASFLQSGVENETPIGIITAYQGDTNIANWMSPDYYQGTCQTKYLHYNAMVYPLRHTKLKGVVWYQGCNNSASGCDYKDLLLKLFANYRDLFNTNNLPFFVIGLCCYDGDSGNNFDFSYVRESQALACALDNNAYFISTCDNGDPTYIHPRAKRYICERVSKSIQSVNYNKDYLNEGPSYKSHTVEGNVVTIELNNSEGLRNNGEIKNLYLAGSDGKYYEATCTLSNNRIIAQSDKVENPVYIKYGFGKSPFVNIYNKDGFAITPFRTDNYNTNIDLFDYESTDKYYFHPDGSKMEVAIKNGNLEIKKLNDGKGYGSVRLDKWGAVIYEPEGFEFTIKGTNSGATISIRFIEGDSYEIWGYKVTDDFEGERTFSINAGDLIVVYNKQNNTFEPQKIGYVEIMVEKNGEATFELCGAKFVKVEKTKPLSFNISTVSEQEETVNIAIAKALFADTYTLSISDDEGVIHTEEKAETSFVVDKNKFVQGKPYYINIVAKNELGETEATNNGFVFYLKDDNEVIVCNFDFKDDAALKAYTDTSMSVHDGLICTLDEKGVKITSTGKGWQQFIFKLETGAGKDMTKMEFYADFTNYKGQVILQLADTNWTVYQYNLNLSDKKEGTFTINFNEFLYNGTPFTTQNLMWVMFNFNDTVGNGYILFDNLKLQK